MNKKLKRAAEFLGFESIIELMGEISVREKGAFHHEFFRPHLEDGRHWLVEMIKKTNIGQWNGYQNLMLDEFRKIDFRVEKEIGFSKWLVTAPSELCFEKIMEVIEVVG